MKIDIGQGRKCREGYEGVDKKDYGQKYKFNLEEEWELKDDSVEEVFSSHCLEHIRNINFFMKELYRVCRKDAMITIVVPFYIWGGAYVDPSHCRFFTLQTFHYFTKDYAEKVDYDMEHDYDFEIIKIELINNGREIKCQMKPKK